ncbi:MAG: 3-oxoacyl-[acyl-carrier-protein] synthase III C-terminal domain-containing protein [Bdellovibrionota bacterium]|nr:MAG: 3-oxoacyl-[acyl-carrier-protein] synthase III C-terminal domain-containing protein [Bdellovibrionota bacterium]
MNKPITIRSIGTAVPEHSYTPEEIARCTDNWLAHDPAKRAIFERFLSSTRTERRSFAIPVPEILSLNGLHGRAEHFEREGPKLGSQAVTRALTQAAVTPESVESFVFTSCSCPTIPSIDALILERVGMSRHTKRIPIYQQGCAGGVVGLGIASQLAHSGGAVLLNSVELCSLVFHSENPSSAELVGSALFADGAACAVVGAGESGLTFIAHQSYLLPNTRHLMGYDLFDDGFHLRLAKELPQSLSSAAPQLVRSFLAQHDLTPSSIPHWLFHPGGIRILELLESAFSLRPEQAPWAREVLQSCGNLSSATVLFVLERFLASAAPQKDDYALLVGVGPGLTLELILFRFAA